VTILSSEFSKNLKKYSFIEKQFKLGVKAASASLGGTSLSAGLHIDAFLAIEVVLY
jgi:hypothetical protein